MAADVHARLVERGETIGCAESLTGGQLAALLSGTPGASASFVGGVVSYATEVKRTLLGVTAAHVVSAECAEQMAVGARRLLGSTWGVATTGVAGPDSQEGQPVGKVFVAVAGPGGLRVLDLGLSGSREEIRDEACHRALAAVRDELG